MHTLEICLDLWANSFNPFAMSLSKGRIVFLLFDSRYGFDTPHHGSAFNPRFKSPGLFYQDYLMILIPFA